MDSSNRREVIASALTASRKVNNESSQEIEMKSHEKKGRRRKKRRIRLPCKLFAIKNKDKRFHEKWKPNADLLDFPHPFRGVFLGPPNSGKTTAAKNIILRQTKPFKRLYVIHCSPDSTNEYKDVDAVMLRCFPDPHHWPGRDKTLVIVDDVELNSLSKHQFKCLDRLFGYVSTHQNVSVILCAQDAFNTPAIVRRCSNLWVLWPCKDIDQMTAIGRKCGVELKDLFPLCKNPRDSIWIDLSDHSPAKLRLNGYLEIKHNPDFESSHERSHSQASTSRQQ